MRMNRILLPLAFVLVASATPVSSQSPSPTETLDTLDQELVEYRLQFQALGRNPTSDLQSRTEIKDLATTALGLLDQAVVDTCWRAYWATERTGWAAVVDMIDLLFVNDIDPTNLSWRAAGITAYYLLFTVADLERELVTC